jgi:sensor histidine kinase regulating citrate/malate metabolism
VRRTIACLIVMSMAVALSNGTAHADDTRAQHHEWMRKLETPGGTFPYALDMEAGLGDALPSVSSGTTYQHRSWIKKLETPNGTLGSSF